MSKLPWYGRLAVFVVLSAAGGGSYYYYYDAPRQEVIARREGELASIQARINQGLAAARKLPEFRQQVGDLEARLDSLKPILPEQKDVGDLLRRIQGLATESKLIIRGFRPQPIAARETHAEWPISLELEGTYHSLGMFLDRVSKFPRIINIGAMVLTQQEPPTSSVTMGIKCTATTFVLVEAPAKKPAAKEPAAKVPPQAGAKS
ncbi:MAG: type 4a pilus biogenesis protein PilO [Vicinamibacterales bacterium]